MNISLEGKIALITGSSRGIGFEIARTFGLSGAKVAICARHRGELKLAEAKLRALGITCLSVVTNLEKPGSEHRTLKCVLRKWGGLDILVNNVGGIAQTGRFEDLTDRAWTDSFQLNLMPTVRFCRASIPHLLKSQCPRIINLSSTVAAQPGSFNPHYSAFKAAIINLTKHLAGLYAKDNLLVNSISPGIIHTEGWDEYIKNKAAQQGLPLPLCKAMENKRAVKNVPLKRLGNRHEVAALAVFLASDHASFITGTNHRVDGGKVLSAV
jgi:NAD(P)-dependent dehydrogenase (short-subunit alcohol dehydrogenase family)